MKTCDHRSTIDVLPDGRRHTHCECGWRHTTVERDERGSREAHAEHEHHRSMSRDRPT